MCGAFFDSYFLSFCCLRDLLIEQKKDPICIGSFYYPSLNRIGSLIRVRTGLPLCFPGSHLGAALTIFTASSSQPPPIPLKTSTS